MGSMHVGLHAFSPMPRMPTAVPGMFSNVEFLWNTRTSHLQHFDEVRVEAVAGEDEFVLYDGALRVVRRAEPTHTRIPATAIRLEIGAALARRRMVEWAEGLVLCTLEQLSDLGTRVAVTVVASHYLLRLRYLAIVFGSALKIALF